MIAINLLGKIPQQLLKINSPMVILLAACSNESNNNTRMHYKRTQPMAWDEFFARESTEKVTKETFLRFIEAFKLSRGKRGGGQIEFIEAALKKLETYGLHKDLDVYKALLKLFPEGELIPKTMFQRMYWWNPQQQSCAIDVLDELEWQGVKPDKELLDIMVARFGKLNFSTKKVHRQLYWLPKLWHTNKYLDRRKVDNKKLLDVELAKIALKMICRDAGTQITSFKAPFVDTPDSFNWIASAQSPLQKRLVADLLEDSTCFVDGPFRVWVRENMMHFVVLSASPTISKDEEFVHMRTSHFVNSPKELHQKLWEFTPNVNVHQQSDQTILALAILGVHSHDYASAWLNHLLEENYQLSKISVLFRLREIQKSIFKFQRDASGAG